MGANVALLMLTGASAGMLGGDLPDSKEALDRLTRAAASKTWSVLKAIDPNLKTKEAIRQEVAGQIYESMPAPWLSADPLELLARGLAGELNVIVRAVRQDLLNRLEGEGTRERFVLRLVERQDAAKDEAAEGDAVSVEAFEAGDLDASAPLSSPPRRRRPDEEAQARQFIEEIAATAEGRRLLRAVAESEKDTQREIAARVGVSAPTLRDWVKRLGPRLTDLL